MFQIKKYILGPIQNNTYLLNTIESQECVIIDPAIGSRTLVKDITRNNLTLIQIWITHAHFDHVGGIQEIENSFSNQIPVCLHPLEIPLWQEGGGGKEFGVEMNLSPYPPIITLMDQSEIKLGENNFRVLHTPGHTPGHITFYCPNQNVAFCGDLIFNKSIGRSDFKGGNYEHLIKSIHEKIMTMPEETRLFCGHGPETTVGNEKKENPFL